MNHVTLKRVGGEAKMLGCQHIVKHSQTGIEFGYGGSGPADCARSILIHFVGLGVADKLYQQFKADVIALVPRDGGATITEAQVKAWVSNKIPALWHPGG